MPDREIIAKHPADPEDYADAAMGVGNGDPVEFVMVPIEAGEQQPGGATSSTDTAGENGDQTSVFDEPDQW